MKRTTLLHAELSGLIAAFGHGDMLVIGDAGLPVPPGVRVIDLALTRGIPGVFDVLDAVLAELVVERSTMASEADTSLQAQFAERDIGPLTLESHDAFKQSSRQARAIVRTGECTPYANIALYAGVAF
ncbi:D-ribose pyranase [Paracoccus sp. Ld10]|uniref:D-ribose pyranase n=1 Tax=Paracoccus sp. Ld10 TaxID=649158 RepID=UPI00386E71A7